MALARDKICGDRRTGVGVNRVAVINVVGMTPGLLPSAPRLSALARGGRAIPLRTVTPAVTCSVQATMLTGSSVSAHGIVANGWYERESAEIKFWRQSNRVVHGEKIWEAAKRLAPSFTCANLFWWFNMYSSADIAATPRPMYPADGRKIPDIWTNPPGLREELQAELGRFPLFKFWGPGAGIESSEWIAASARRIEERFAPTLSLVYLPHLDYNLQRLGPGDAALARDVAAIDEVVGGLIEFYQERGVTPIVLSEYGVTDVSCVSAPNRALRDAGLLAVREELGREYLDAGASRAFAVADHQIAHVYAADARARDEAKIILTAMPGVEQVLDDAVKRECGLDHARSGDLVLIAERHAWFTYDFWEDASRAPDYARTVDIHRKPGYDPRELFVDPAIALPGAKIAWKLMKKRLGFRTLMDVVPLDATLVRGSHGRVTDDERDGPMVIVPDEALVNGAVNIEAADVKGLVLRAVFGGGCGGELNRV